MKIHPQAEVYTQNIGFDTLVWQYTVILEGAIIGNNCNINCHVFIENDVIIGDNVTVKSGVYIWDGLRIEDNVFIGPNVTFTNDKMPRSKKYPEVFQHTQLGEGCSIGAGAIVLGGIGIGSYAMIGAGALVTKDVPSRALVIGSPARIAGWVDADGSKMKQISESSFEDSQGRVWKVVEGELLLI
jgi:acetyltransferase-like isoleucine patch superfamily enzyme